ncbi:MAG: MoaD/ThiS family protein [Actinomycetia bacterium]|nr:MoaD/ThiS family protein [Actinomycetes bacterium]
MAVTVRIPTILRTYTNNEAEVSLPDAGETLQSALTALEAAAPGIGARILDDKGALRRFVNVYVDDEDVRFTNGLETPLTQTSAIAVIPAVAGG